MMPHPLILLLLVAAGAALTWFAMVRTVHGEVGAGWARVTAPEDAFETDPVPMERSVAPAEQTRRQAAQHRRPRRQHEGGLNR